MWKPLLNGVVGNSLKIVCGLLCAVFCLWSVVCCSLFGVCCALLVVVRRLLFVVC